MRKIWVLLGLSLLMGIFACARTTTTTTTPTTTSSTTTTTTTTTSTSTTTSSTTTTTAFLILFEENGGSAVADYTSSSQLSQLPVTTRTGFTFSGWYIDPECTVVFNPETPRTDWTFTLYAGWTPLEQVTVTFESNGGSPVFSWIMYSGDTLTFPTNPVKTGYSFGGWYSEPELTTVYVPAALSESITLYARWIPAQVNVTVERYLEGLDGIYVKTETASMLRYTEALAEAPLLPQTGFTVNPSHPAAVLSGTVAPDGSLVLKVYYDRNDYTIAFEANADLSIRSITLAYGSPVTKPSDPIRAGFSFLGWFSDPDKTLPYSFTTMPAANILVYAKWLGDPATLAFDSHGGSAVSNIVAPRESGIDSPTDPVRDGFLFDGWFTDSGYTDPFTVWVMPNANLTLHAKWIPVEFSIVFEENGGSAVSDLSAPFQSVIQAPSDPVKPDYVFRGWFSNPELTNAFVFSTMPLNGITLYAKWVSASEANLIENIIALDEGTFVEVTGIVFAQRNPDQVGFYVYDSSGFLLVQAPFDSVQMAIGNRLKISGLIRFRNGVPTLSHVSAVELLDSGHPLPDVFASPLGVVNDTLPAPAVYSSPVRVRGVLMVSPDGYFLADWATGTEVRLDLRMLGNWSAYVNRYVEADVLFSRNLGEWELGVYRLSEPVLNDAEKIQLLHAWWEHEVSSRTFVEEEPLQFPMTLPFGWGSITYQFNETNRQYIDDVNGLFKTVETVTDVIVPVQIVCGSATASWDWTLSLHPATVATIAEFLNAAPGKILQLQVRVTMACDGGIVLLEDGSGAIYLFTSTKLLIGDELLLYVRRNASQGFVYLEASDLIDYEMLSRTAWINDPADPMTPTEFLALDWNNPLTYGQYVELRGFLEQIPYDSDSFHEGFRLTDGTQMFLPIDPVTYSGFETLFQMEGLEVLIRGYLAVDEQGDPILYFTGVRREIQIPAYSDQERVDMIGRLFAREHAGQTLASYDEFGFMPYHPVLGGTIVWDFPEGFSDLYDFSTHSFKFVNAPTELTIQMTISQGEVSKTFEYQTTLMPPKFTNIADLANTPTDQVLFVRGLVVYRHPQYFYLQDETGLVLVWESNIDCYAGDYVVLRCEKQRSDGEWGTGYLQKVDRDDENEAFLLKIVSRDQEIVVRPSDRSLAEIVQSDPKLESSFNHYVTLTGRLSASTNFPGYFELRRGEDFVLVTYPDDYTYYKLETMVGSGEIQVTMKGFLFDYDVDDDVWYLLWTGLDLTETAPEYTDEQKAQLIAEWLTDQVAGSIPGNGTLSLPATDPDFGGTITYTVSGPNAGLVDLVNQTVQAVLEPTTVEAHATIVIGSVTRVLDFTWTIVPAVAEGSWMWIEDLITEAPSVGVWISGTVLAAYEGEDGTTVLIEDPTGRLSVTLPSTEWFYGGYVMVGEILDAYGFLSRELGSWEFRATEYGFSPGSDSLSETFDPLTLGQLDAIDIDDPSQIGKAVETVGLLRKNADGTLVLAGHGIEIAILSCYAESNFLNEWIGFPLRLRGFYAGLETSGAGIQRIGFAFVSYAFDGVESWEMMPLEDQEIAQILLDRLNPQIDGMIFQPFDQWYLQPYHPLLETAEVSFTVLQGAPWVSYADSYLSFTRPDGDVEGILRMSVTYGTGVATRDIVFTLNGFFLGTLDDLFVSDENLTEVGVPMTVIYAQWGYCYFEYLDRIYYYDGFIPDWVQQNQAVILFGKRTTVDGIPELTYEIRALGNATDEYTLIPLNVDLQALYAGGINYPEHYLRLSGTLGYDPFLDLFTLSADGKMVYIRDTMEEGSDGEYRWAGDGGLLTRQDFRDLLGEPVYLQVLLSSVMIRNEFLLVDFRGYSSELGLMPLGIEEALQVVGNKVYAQWNERTFMSGDGIGWELPAFDPIHGVDIYYSVAPGQDASLIDWGNGGIVGLLTEPTDLQIIAEMVYYGAAEDPYTFSITFTLHLLPAPMVTVREALWGITGQYYIVEGVVEYFFDDWWIILSDETGTIYIDANSYSSYFGHTIAVGDTIRILGMRRGYENEDYVPILDSVADLEVLSHGAAPTRTPVTMTVEEMMALDYLCPDVYNQYVSITGTVIFSGNISYPSFDIREAGMPSDATYDIQIWSNTYYDFNDVMDPLVGSVIRVEGYLIGFQYIYAPFDWIVLHVNHEVLVP